MAIVNPLQQRLMMERMRRDPRLAALMAARGEGGLAELAGLPQGAMNLAELAGMAPPAQVVTPAQPAPVQPGAEVRAPTETVGGEEVAKEEAPDVEPIKTPPPLPNTPLGRAQQEAIKQDIEARAARYVDPREALIFAGQTERYGKELAALEKDSKRAGWEALAMAGFKMAQSQSPYFMSALASGMEAGLTGYNANKMARAERKARLQAAREQVTLNQISAERAAEQRERDRQSAMQESIARTLGLETAGKKAEFEEYLYPFRRQIEGPLAVEKTLADIADTRASAGDRSAAAANVGMVGPGRGTTVTANRVSELHENYAKATEKALEKKVEWEAAGKPKEGPELAAYRAAQETRQIYAEAWRNAVPGAREFQKALEAGGAKRAKKNAPNAPKVGEVVQGYRFKGGNPANRQNWEKVR